MLARKKTLANELVLKKENLHGLVQDSKQAQNKAMKMTRIIRADKEAYLKLGSLQQSTSKGQVSLKGWKPAEANNLSYS